MFRLLKAMFSTPMDATSVVSTVSSGIDKSWFTKQEAAGWFLSYLDATLPMNLSRRVIAISVTFIWAISALVLLALTGFRIESATAVKEFIGDIVNPVFMLVTGFYFVKAITERLAGKK